MDERLSGCLLGRAPELALLRRQLAAALDAVPGVVLVGGDAGTGRTRLLAQFCAEVRSGAPPSALVLTGTCHTGEVPVPLAPLIEALRPLPGDRSAWALVGEAGRRSELFEHVLTTVAALGRERLVALVVDDLHRADPVTLELLAYLAQNLRHARTLLVLGWCSELLPCAQDVRPYVARLAREAGAVRIELPPLTRAELTALVTAATGRPLAPAARDSMWRRSAGNPSYALDLLAAGIATDPGCPLPDALTARLHERLDALGLDARHVVRVVAAAGPAIDHRSLATRAGLPPARLFGALREAVERHVLVPDGDGERYRFSHPLLGEAAGEQLLPGEREHLRSGAPAADGGPAHLTPREHEVLALLASGARNRDIAGELRITEKTASVHVSNILAKFGVRSRTAAAAEAHRLGVLR